MLTQNNIGICIRLYLDSSKYILLLALRYK